MKVIRIRRKECISVCSLIVCVVFSLYVYENSKRSLLAYDMDFKLSENTRKCLDNRDSVSRRQGTLGFRSDIVLGDVKNDADYLKNKENSTLFGVNMFLSDIIGFRRRLDDIRPEQCKEKSYIKDLPVVSIVVIFRDEPLSTLLRTVYGILDTCPDHLLEEIVLVDDGSVMKDTIIGVKIHVANLHKVKMIRNEKSMGLMNARHRGISEITSDHFIVLDAHVEFNVGWLEPILYRLKQEPKALLTSDIAQIDKETFEIHHGPFDKAFLCFEQVSLNEQFAHYSDEYLRKRNGKVDPIEICIFRGMMMAMNKHFYFQIGGFDTGMEVWGIEHIEMSVKVWLCGGRVELVPCSIVAHLFRITPWQTVEKTNTYVFKNKLRFAEVWMDGSVKKLMIDSLSKGHPTIDSGDLTKRKEIRDQNKCQSYSFFMQKIKSLTDGIYFPEKPQRYGRIINKAKQKCLDAVYSQEVSLILYQCHQLDNQNFLMTKDGRIKNILSWLKVGNDSQQIVVDKDAQFWWRDSEYVWRVTEKGAIQHVNTAMCLVVGDENNVVLATCNEQSGQQWEWEKFPIS